MTDLTPIIQAYQQQRLLLLWSDLPFTLPNAPPANRVVAINRQIAAAQALPPLSLPLASLPPLPLLSLDPTPRLERALAAAGTSPAVVASQQDVPVRGRPSLLQLAGDLPSRRGLILSRRDLRDLPNDADKRYLLAEARRRVEGGALLVVGADPAHLDFAAWWSVVWPGLGRPAAYVLGDPAADWPTGLTPLAVPFADLAAQLAAVEPAPETGAPAFDPDGVKQLIATHRRRLQKLQEQQAFFGAHTPPHIAMEIEDITAQITKLETALGLPPAPPPASAAPEPPTAPVQGRTGRPSLQDSGHSTPSQPPPARGRSQNFAPSGEDSGGASLGQPKLSAPEPAAGSGGKYNINISGNVTGLTIGDGNRIEQQFGSTAEPAPDWPAHLARLEARLDALSQQVEQGVADLKRGQRAIVRRLTAGQQAELDQLRAAVEAGRLPQAELQATLTDLRNAMRAMLNHGVPMDAELRAAVADLTEAVESSLSLDQKLELALPLVPFLLNYKIELGAGSDLDLHDLADALGRRWRGLLAKLG